MDLDLDCQRIILEKLTLSDLLNFYETNKGFTSLSEENLQKNLST